MGKLYAPTLGRTMMVSLCFPTFLSFGAMKEPPKVTLVVFGHNQTRRLEAIHEFPDSVRYRSPVAGFSLVCGPEVSIAELATPIACPARALEAFSDIREVAAANIEVAFQFFKMCPRLGGNDWWFRIGRLRVDEYGE